MQGIQKYLQCGLSPSLLAMVNEERLFTCGMSFPSDVLVNYMCSFAEGLVRAVESVPSLVRYFLHRAFQIGGLELLQILVYDLFIKSVLMNSKLFALFPETAAMASDTRALVDLTRIFWWAIKPDQLQQVCDNDAFERRRCRTRDITPHSGSHLTSAAGFMVPFHLIFPVIRIC
jgi:hypothetical protein